MLRIPIDSDKAKKNEAEERKINDDGGHKDNQEGDWVEVGECQDYESSRSTHTSTSLAPSIAPSKANGPDTAGEAGKALSRKTLVRPIRDVISGRELSRSQSPSSSSTTSSISSLNRSIASKSQDLIIVCKTMRHHILMNLKSENNYKKRKQEEREDFEHLERENFKHLKRTSDSLCQLLLQHQKKAVIH